MNTIILVRHGESESNTDKRFTGQLDSPLTATGKEQARLTAKYLDKYKIDKVYSSHLIRARETADAIVKRQNCQFEISHDFCEIYAGKWEGLTFDEISVKYPETYSLWIKDLKNANPDEGESIKELYDRVIEKFKAILLEKDETI